MRYGSFHHLPQVGAGRVEQDDAADKRVNTGRAAASPAPAVLVARADWRALGPFEGGRLIPMVDRSRRREAQSRSPRVLRPTITD